MSGRICRLHGVLAFVCLLLAVTPASAQPGEVTGVDFIDSLQITWDPLAATAGYHVYRGDLAGLEAGDYGACLFGSVQGTSVYEFEDPLPGEGRFYLAGGFDPAGPGTLGSATSGAARLPTVPCIGSRRYFPLIPGVAPDGLPTREPLRNPAVEAWTGTRESTGVVLHSGEFTLSVLDPLGGDPRHDGSEFWESGGRGGGRIAVSSPSIFIGSGGAKFFPGEPIADRCTGGGGSGGMVACNVDDELGVGEPIGINITVTPTRAAIGDGSPVRGGDEEIPSPASWSPSEDDKGWLERWLERIRSKYLSRVEGVERHYRSQISYDGPFGHGWEFTANSRLEPSGSDVTWYDGTGRRFVFHRTSPTDFTSPMGCYAKLIQETSYFYLRLPDGTIRTHRSFDGSNTQGALLQEETLDGKATFLFRDHQGLLTQAVDDLGRVVSFTYNSDGRIDRITDFSGRTVEYGYDPEGNLASVRSPLVTGTPNGNDFPTGKTTTYTYTSGHPEERLNHNLISIISPKEALSGIPFLENSYEPDPNSFAFDRVTAQVIGGLGSGGVPAGGALSYDYVPLNPGGDPFDMGLPRREVTVVDRNGNERVWLVNAAGNAVQLTQMTNRNLRPGEPDYVTQAAYNPDGEVLGLALPAGNEIVFTYDRPGADRYREGDLLEARLLPDQPASGGRGDGHGGNLGSIAYSYSYDPLGRRISTMTDPMGRQSTWTYDYQEGDPNTTVVGAIASAFGVDTSGVAFNLGDLNGDGYTSQVAARPVLVEYPTVGLQPGSNQALIEGDLQQEIVYTLGWNNHAQLTSLLDPEGNLHTFEYHPETDPDGDGTPTPPPPIAIVLDPVTGGYLKSVHLDTISAPGRNNGTNPPPAVIETDYEYDPVGNRISEVNGRGVRTSWTYNQLDQLVELRRASATAILAGPHGDPATGRGEVSLDPSGYRTWYFYDENDNLAQRQTEEVGGSTGAGPWIETLWTHDILDNATAHAQEVAPATFLTTEFRYDANENLELRIQPEGTVDRLLRDERDLALSSTRGLAGPHGGVPATRQYEYDGNANLTRVTDGRGGLIDYEHDGADRLARIVDQVGSTRDYWHDPAGNIVHEVTRGPGGGPPPPDRTGSTNVDLSVSTYSYDDLNRLVRKETALQVASGAPPVRTPILQEGALEPGDGQIDHAWEYDRLSRQTYDLRDTTAETRREYDGVGRVLEITDAAGDVLAWTWDSGSNPVELVELESPSVPGPPTEMFLTTFFYDAVDRRVMQVDNIGQTRHWLYNSLDLVEVESDPRSSVGGFITRRSAIAGGAIQPINAHGNVVAYEYDGAGRRTWEIRTLTASGEGDGTTLPSPDTTNLANPDGLIVLGTTWNGNSRPATRTDDRGNTTTYEYDNLNRLVRIIADDGTQATSVYDGEDNPTQSQDAAGSVIDRTYDAAHRLIGAAVTPGPGVAGSTLQTFEHDGLSRVTQAFDVNDPGDPADDVEIRYTYDSLGRVLEEHQSTGSGPTGTTSYGWEAEDLLTDLVTPSSLQASYGYDFADRLTSVTAGGASASFEYFGSRRVHTRHYGNGGRLTMMDDTGTLDVGFDGARRIDLMRYLDPNNMLLGGYDYLYDRAGNRVAMRRLHHPDPNGFMGESSGYDSAGRLTSWWEGILDAGYVPVGPVRGLRLWQLDGAGNWASHDIDGLGMTSTPNNNNEYDEPQAGGTRVDNGVEDDFSDEILTLPPDGVNLAHDKNGSQIYDGTHQLSYDAFGRLVEAVNLVGGVTVSRYSYDPLGRRIGRTVTNRGALDETRRYLYAGTGVVEEQDQAGTVTRSAVAGIHGRDWLWQVTGGGSVQYYLQDALGSTVGMTDDAFPDVIERVIYKPYGRPEFTDPNNLPLTDPNGLPAPRSTVGNPILFAGMRHDPEGGGCTAFGWGPDCGGAYVTLHRRFSPFQGRFLSRDPLGMWADPWAAGNAYVYAGGNPLTLSDPLGLGPDDALRLRGTVSGKIGESSPVDFTGSIAVKRPFEYRKGPVKATLKSGQLKVKVKPDRAEELRVMFNPKEISVKKTVPWDQQKRPRKPSK